MLFDTTKLKEINVELEIILETIPKFEERYQDLIDNVHPNYRLSARNLIHYLALGSCDMDQLQKKLRDLDFSNTMNSELEY